jgi:S-adenosylmethionine hydroxide adenosyltransferase-like protein/tetratricopeptide repeat protein
MKKILMFLLIAAFWVSCSINSSQQEIDDPGESVSKSLQSDLTEIKFNVYEDELQGSEITIAAPVSWQKKILILAHGFRPEEVELFSSFSITDPFYQKLLENGWIIASTSYKRNGLILHEAVEDIELLRKYLEDKYGKSEEIYLYGSSMGSTISTLIAEDPALPYTGVLAIGFPKYHLYQIGGFEHTFDPHIPILFVSNRDETEAPSDYLLKSGNAAIKPAFWTVDRDGHCLVNSEETSAAFEALINYVATGDIEFSRDCTVVIEPTGSRADFRDGKAYAEVLSVHPSYGNFESGFYASDLQKMGIELNTYFRVGFKDRFFRIYYGTTYSDVFRGFWVAFITADGTLRIARNFADASKLLKCKQGDNIYIEPLAENEQNVIPYIEPGTEAADLGIGSWENLISGNAEQAVVLAEKGLAISPDLIWLKMNLAHAYLFSGEYEKAVEIYSINYGKHIFKESFYFEDLVLEDLEKLEREGLKNEDTDKIRELLKKMENE